MDSISVVIVCSGGAEAIRDRIEFLYKESDESGLKKDTLLVTGVSDPEIIKQLAGESYLRVNPSCETVTFEVQRLINLISAFYDHQREHRLIRISVIYSESFTVFDFSNNSIADQYEEIFDDIIGIYLQEAEGIIIVLGSIKEMD